MGGGAGGMSVASPVELPQLGQLLEKLFDHDCVATLLLLVMQRSRPNCGTPDRSQCGHRPWSPRGCCGDVPFAVATLRRRAVAVRLEGQIALVQALHFVASTAFASLQKGHVLTSGAGGSLMNMREIHQTTKAITMKAMIALMNAP